MSAVFDRIAEAIETDERAVLFTVIEGEPRGAHMLVLESGERVGDELPDELAAQAGELIREHTNRIVEVGDTRVFAEIYAPPPRLLVYGAVDTAESLAKLARQLGWQAIVADARPKFRAGSLRARPASLPDLCEEVV